MTEEVGLPPLVTWQVNERQYFLYNHYVNEVVLLLAFLLLAKSVSLDNTMELCAKFTSPSFILEVQQTRKPCKNSDSICFLLENLKKKEKNI